MENCDLAMKRCVPCAGGVPPLDAEERASLLARLRPGWQVLQDRRLEKTFRFEDFKGALEFTNRVGELAESEGHHPDIYLAWGKAVLTIWTHKINGLTESDFIFAAKADEAYPR